MDETQIAEKLRQNIPQVDDSPQPEPTTAPQNGDGFASNVSLDDPVTTIKVCDFFGVRVTDLADLAVSTQIRAVFEWAKERGASSLDEVFSTISQAENMLGTRYSERRLFELYRFAKTQKLYKEIGL